MNSDERSQQDSSNSFCHLKLQSWIFDKSCESGQQAASRWKVSNWNKIENLAKRIKSWKFTDWQQVRLKSVYATHTDTIDIWTSILVLNKLCVLFAFPQWKRLNPMLEKMLKKSPRLFFLSSSSKEFFSCSNNWSLKSGLKWAKNCSSCTSEEKINGDCATNRRGNKIRILVNWNAKCWLLRFVAWL